MNPKLIVIDGKTYNSASEMPAEVRAKYEKAISTLKDEDRNRVPDVFENNKLPGDDNRNGIPDAFENTMGAQTFQGSMKIVMDGKEINSIEDLPPDARARYDKAMSGLDANRNGVPDFLEGMIGTPQKSTTVSTNFESDAPPPVARKPMPVSSTVTPDTSNGWMLVLLGVVLMLFCGAAAVGLWYFFLR